MHKTKGKPKVEFGENIDKKHFANQSTYPKHTELLEYLKHVVAVRVAIV